MASGLSRIELKALRRSIARMSRYWFARLILEWGCDPSRAFKNQHNEQAERLTTRCSNRRWATRRYRALRAQGLSRAEALARRDGRSLEAVKAYGTRTLRQLHARWGGWHTYQPGTEAWKRRMLHKEQELPE